MRFFLILCMASLIRLNALIWSPLTEIDSSSNAFSQISLVVDSFGNAIAAWIEEINGSTVARAATLPFQGSWSTPETISNPGLSVSGLALGINQSGYAVAAWIQAISGGVLLQASTHPLNGSWSTPVNFPGSFNLSSTIHLVVDSSNDAIIVWDDGTSTSIKAASLPFGSSPSATTTISSGSSNYTSSCAIDGLDNVRAIWTFGANEGIKTAYLPSGSIWGAPSTIISGTNLSSGEIVLDPSGNATVIWREDTGSGGAIIQTSYLPFGGSWSSTTNIFTSTEDSNGKNLAVDSSGNVVAVYANFTASGGSEGIIQAARLPFGGSWQSAVNLTGTLLSPLTPSIAFDPEGNGYVLWVTQLNNSTFKVQTTTLPAGSTSWLPPLTIYTDKQGYGFSPIIASDVTDNAVGIGFILNNKGTYELVASQGTSIAPPTNPLANQILHRFPTQGDLINNLSWTPPLPHAIDHYNIYRGYETNLIGSVATPDFLDHQRTPGVSYNYFITSVNESGEESSAITITCP